MAPFLLVAAGSALALSFAAAGGRRRPERGFLRRVHRGPGGKVKYTLFVPHAYTGDTPCPLILFLHGAGETGADGHRPVTVGLGPEVEAREADFPFITVFPQSQRRTWQAGSADAQRALAILDEIEAEFNVDPRRVYLTGISMGGFGTWSLAARQPERWAAIAPVCGGGDPATADRIRDIPCWCFHGAEDDIVPVAHSRRMIEALEAAGGRPRYTEYPDVGHDSWVKAYATEELYDWLLRQRLR